MYKKIKEVEFREKPYMILKFSNVQIKKTTANADYASLIGFDGEDQIEVKIWKFTDDIKNILKTGEVYVVHGEIKDYQGKKQLNLDELRLATSDDCDIDQFYEYAPLTKEELQKKISSYINKIENEVIKKIVVKAISKYSDEYFSYPAAVSIHHNFICGLAYHTYSMLTLSEPYLKLYTYLNKDLVYAGIILHDIGKVKELSSSKSPEYTHEGNLLGHISIGANILHSVCESLGYSDKEEALALEHIILSHHGKNEFGSPVTPSIPEAALIFLLDFSDSRLAALGKALKDVKKGEKTDPVVAFDKKVFYVTDLD